MPSEIKCQSRFREKVSIPKKTCNKKPLRDE